MNCSVCPCLCPNWLICPKVLHKSALGVNGLQEWEGNSQGVENTKGFRANNLELICVSLLPLTKYHTDPASKSVDNTQDSLCLKRTLTPIR